MSIKLTIIKKINSNQTYEIRKNVLWPHIINNDYSLDIDNDKETFHLGVFYKKKIVSIGTFVKQENNKFKNVKQYRLRAMGTEFNFKKRGFGKLLIKEAITVLKEKKVQLLWCDARLKAVDFYKKQGMKSLGKIYDIKNIGIHKTMYINI